MSIRRDQYFVDSLSCGKAMFSRYGSRNMRMDERGNLANLARSFLSGKETADVKIE